MKSNFKDLYTSASRATQEEYDRFIQELCLPKLSDKDRDEPGGLLTYDEFKQVLKTFQNDKSPGENGFTVDFYKFFFELLGHNLFESFNEAYEANELSISQRSGIVTLIPKEDGSLSNLSNW